MSDNIIQAEDDYWYAVDTGQIEAPSYANKDEVDATEGHIDPFFYPGENDVPEDVRKEALLDNFTTEELEAEIDRRFDAKVAIEHPLFPETMKMLDDFVNLYTPNTRDRNDEMPF